MHHTTHEETLQFTAFKLRAPQRLHPSRLQLSPGSKMLFSPAPLKLCFSVLSVFHVLGIPAQILFNSPSFLPRPVVSWTAVSERSLPGCSSYHSDPSNQITQYKQGKTHSPCHRFREYGNGVSDDRTIVTMVTVTFQ